MSLSIKELKNIANILRRDSIESTTHAGSGHVTSCLSCAELMSVLFFNELSFDIKNSKNPDNDEFILSKGHAAPIYYSALKRLGLIKTDLNTLRKSNSSLEGHPLPRSINWVKTATGSLGQGLATGLGFALAAKIQNKKYKTYVLLGDGETAEGSVWEALALGSYYNLNNLVALFDINRLGETGQTMLGHDLQSYAARISSFGWDTYIIDGHKIKSILRALRKSRNSKRPVAILARTYKGYPISFLTNQNHKHGKALTKEESKKALSELPNPIMPKITIRKPEKTNYLSKTTIPIVNEDYFHDKDMATRDAYGFTLRKLAEKNNKIIAVDADLSDSTRSERIQDLSPEKSIECFISEQAMISVSLGLAKKGLIPFASTFSAFFSRAHDQLRMASHSFDNDFTLVCAGSHAGISIGEDGVSQMGLEDISLFRSLSNSVVLYPSDSVSTEKLISEAIKQKGIIYLRLSRPKTLALYNKSESFPIGDFKVLKESSKDNIVLIGAGITVHECLKASNKLKNSAVIDLYSIKPLNTQKLINFIRKHGNKIIITEDHYKEGGIGEMLSTALANTNIKIKTLAVKGIPHSAKTEELLRKHNIDAKAIIETAKKLNQKV